VADIYDGAKKSLSLVAKPIAPTELLDLVAQEKISPMETRALQVEAIRYDHSISQGERARGHLLEAAAEIEHMLTMASHVSGWLADARSRLHPRGRRNRVRKLDLELRDYSGELERMVEPLRRMIWQLTEPDDDCSQAVERAKEREREKHVHRQEL